MSRSKTTVLFALFFLSGASGLVYEVVWVRMLTRVFGSTTFAVSALLTAFMAGLSAGSELSGRFLARARRPLRVFAALEAGIGAFALGLPVILPVLQRVFLSGVGALGLSGRGEHALDLVLSLALLVPPTALMGASLPVLAQLTVGRLGELGHKVGGLYAVNTLGAAVGCFLAGFFGLPALGIRGTTAVAAAVNVMVAGLALALDRGTRPEPRDDAGGVASEGTAALYGAHALGWAAAAFAVSGLAALGFELIWTRLITLVFTGFTYSFTAMLTVFLLGLAGGSLVAARWSDRVHDPLALFGLLEIAIGLAAVGLAPLFGRGQAWVATLAPAGSSFAATMAAKFAVAFALLIVPSLLFGATFPVVARVGTRARAGLGASVGRLYAANVAGGIGGSLLTGFVLLPAFGSHASLRALAVLLVALGLAAVFASPVGAAAPRAGAGVLALTCAVAVAMTPSDVSLAIHRSWLVAIERLSFYREGAEATVMVAEYDGRAGGRPSKRILVNGSSASNSTYYGLSVNRIQGSLPFVFDRTPRRALAICFGTGITFGTLAQYDLERVDGVEIAPQVLEAASRFATDNYDAVASPRLRLHVDDGRNFLLKSRERYDIITMEPMPPALAGVADLYTREFYDLCRTHLEPGGLVSQWVPLYSLGADDVRMLYRTFAESFPEVALFVYRYDTFLVGSDRPLRPSVEAFAKRLTSDRLRRDLAAIDLGRPEQLLATYAMGRDDVLRVAAGAPVLTDDHPQVEFTAPRSAAVDTAIGNRRMIDAFAGPAAGPAVTPR